MATPAAVYLRHKLDLDHNKLQSTIVTTELQWGIVTRSLEDYMTSGLKWH